MRNWAIFVAWEWGYLLQTLMSSHYTLTHFVSSFTYFNSFNLCNNPTKSICYYPNLQRGWQSVRERLSNMFKVTPPISGWTKVAWLQNLLSQPLTLSLYFVNRKDKKGEIRNAREKTSWSTFWEEARSGLPKDTYRGKRRGIITSSLQGRRKREKKREKWGILKQVKGDLVIL